MEDKSIKLSENDVAGGFEEFIGKYKWQVGLVFLGLILAGLGVLGTKFWGQQKEGIEIITADKEQQNSQVLVDLQGAVDRPGVYQLPADSRVNDLLIKAGGLSVEADRDWVAKNLNLAQKLADGIKIYVPKKSEFTVDAQAVQTGRVAGSQFSRININTASLSQLETLPGVGPSYAQKIIENRPYQKPDDLLKVPGIGSKKFNQIKDKITLY